MPNKIKKIKLSGENVLIEYIQPTADGYGFNKHTIESKEQPSPEFEQTLQLLAPFVSELYELPETYSKGMEVISATFIYKGDADTLGCTITAKKTVNTSHNSALFHTPIVYVSTGEDQEKVMSGRMEEIINDLQDCARDYIDGERAQQTLFEGAE